MNRRLPRRTPTADRRGALVMLGFGLLCVGAAVVVFAVSAGGAVIPAGGLLGCGLGAAGRGSIRFFGLRRRRP